MDSMSSLCSLVGLTVLLFLLLPLWAAEEENQETALDDYSIGSTIPVKRAICNVVKVYSACHGMSIFAC